MTEPTTGREGRGASASNARTNGDARAAGRDPAPEVVAKAETTKSPLVARELLRADAGDVEATTVAMERSGAERVQAERLTMERSGAKTIAARSAQLDRSGVVSLSAERAVLHDGSAGAVVADEARLVRSRALVVVSGRTTVEGGLRTLLHVGPVEGEVRPLLDGGGALRWGAVIGVITLLLGVRRRWRG